MRLFFKLLALTLSTALLGGQITQVGPTLTGISPAFGGVGPNATGPWTLTGTGFSTTPKAVRFVDDNGVDVFSTPVCSSATSCQASVRPGRVPAGTVATVNVHALVGGLTSGGTSFLYYGALNITSLSPNTGAWNANTPYTINGGPFTSGASFPGTTSIYLFLSIVDLTNGCGSTSACAATAPTLTGDCCAAQGARSVSILTPGGSANPYFIYGTAPATPTITSISPTGGSTSGGQVVTITGTNFITGGNSSGAPFGVTLGTTFTFTSAGGFSSNPATSVNCTSTTSCTATVPSGNGAADVQVQTVCPINSATFCASSNPRPSMSIPTTKTAAYTYAGIKTNPAGGLGNTLYTSENGQAAQFTVALNSQPSANVHVAVSTNGGFATLSTSGLDFTTANWSTPQTVTATGIDDTGIGGAAPPSTGNLGYNVNLVATSTDPNYNNVNGNAPNFVNIDNDTKQFFIAPQSGLVTTRAGGTATFTVVLSQPPSATVTVNLASNDPLEGTVSPASLTFLTTSGGGTGWNVPRTVTVTGLNDGVTGQGKPYSILVTSSSADTTYGNASNLYPADVSVTNTDAPPAIVTNPSNVTVNAGQMASFSAAASGVPAPTVQWQVSAGGPFTDIPGAISTTYAFVTVAGDNGKSLRAVFTNTGGTATTTAATLTVNVPTSAPVVTLNPAPTTTVLTGNAIFISANATGSPTPTAQWQVSTNGGASWVNIFGATSFNLSFTAERADNGKQYRAVFTNSVGSASTASAALFVRLRVRTDVDNDRKSDLVVWRPSSGTWFWLTSGSSYNYGAQGQKQWGNSGLGDVPLSADMDGDGIMDLVVWRASTGTWYWLSSTTGYSYSNVGSKQWGNGSQNDVPLLGDIDGDGRADLIVWRPASGTWYYLLSSTGYNTAAAGIKQWGNSSLGDQPVLGDFDGDGLADLTVWRASTGTWFWLTSSSGYATSNQKQWGNQALGDVPLVADIDGDGVSDLVIWRASSGTFYWLTAISGYDYTVAGIRQWGNASLGDVPMLGDIEGDGIADLIVWRASTGTWFWLTSSTGFSLAGQGQKQWGASTDLPMIK